MHFQMDHAVEVLQHTPGVLDALLRGKSDAWLNCRETPQSFSPVDVLGHLMIADQTNWIPRARIILEAGRTRTFESFDRLGFRPLIEGRPVEHLLDEFRDIRIQSLRALRELHVTPELMDTRGHHPELGEVTLRHLLSAWVVHDLSHTSQIVRVMAGEYREAVGPYREYLRIIK